MSAKNDGWKSFWWFQSIAWIWIFWATFLYPYLKHIVFPTVPLITIVAMVLLLFITHFVKHDKWVIEDYKASTKKVWHMYLYDAFIMPLVRWWNFIKVNRGYPLFYVWYAFFRWFVYTALLFLIPLYLIDVKNWGFLAWLPLGIYELVVIFFGWIVWVFADKINRRYYTISGRLLIIIAFVCMIFWNDMLSLVIFWFIAWMWRNIMYSASTHILEKHNIDRKEDPDFTAFQRTILKVWSVLAPLMLGPLFHWWWFHVSLALLSYVVVLMWIIMIWLTFKIPTQQPIHQVFSQ
jgi:hypothetical protein